MSEKKYLYDYQISEVNRNGISMLIACYYSNFAPPQIGSLIYPSEFAEKEYRHNRYKVVQVEILPHSADGPVLISDIETVFITVEQVKK